MISVYTNIPTKQSGCTEDIWARRTKKRSKLIKEFEEGQKIILILDPYHHGLAKGNNNS